MPNVNGQGTKSRREWVVRVTHWWFMYNFMGKPVKKTEDDEWHVVCTDLIQVRCWSWLLRKRYPLVSELDLNNGLPMKGYRVYVREVRR